MKKNVNSVHSVPCSMPASACTWLSDPELLITSLRVAFLFLQHFVAFIAYTSCSEKKTGKTNPKGGQAAYGETAADGHGSTQFAQSSKWWRTADPFFYKRQLLFPLSIFFRSVRPHCQQSSTLLILLTEPSLLPVMIKRSLAQFKPKHLTNSCTMHGGDSATTI